MIFDYMDAKRKSGMSWADLEEATGVPASTLRDHMGGGVKSPDQDILDAARSAMDPQGAPQGPQGIPQAPQGIPQAPQGPQGIPQAPPEIPQGVEMVPASTLAVAQAMYERQLSATVELYKQQVASLEAQLAKAEARIKHLTIALAACVIFFVLILVVDLLNRDIGWFRDALGLGLDAARPAGAAYLAPLAWRCL